MPAKKLTRSFKTLGVVKGYRSGLEVHVANQLTAAGLHDAVAAYETQRIEYTKPATKHRYTPDFPLPNGIIVETKGRFLPDDRAKHLLVKAQHPEKDIRFVFYNSKAKLYKGSPTTYAAWCEKNGFLYADKLIPASWLTESKSK